MFLILSSALLEVCALLSSIVVIIIIIIIALVVDSSGLKKQKDKIAEMTKVSALHCRHKALV